MCLCVRAGHKLDCVNVSLKESLLLKGIQMGDRVDDGAVLYSAALGCFAHSLVCAALACSRVVQECVTQWG